MRPFLREFLSDPYVVDLPRLPWLLLLNLVIVPIRSPKSARLYEKIWTPEGSPLLAITKRQVAALEDRLSEKIPVAIGMRYGAPSLAAAVDELIAQGCRKLLLLPLYPQFSRTTTQTTVNAVARTLIRHPGVELDTITDFHDDPAYIKALAASVRETRERLGSADHLIMSFHGIPVRYATAGDPYPQQCAATARLLAKELDLDEASWTLAYQSRFGREPWLEPATDQVLRQLGERGVRSVEILCPGFPTDCLETLEEIALGGAKTFKAAGGDDYRYIPSLNDRGDFIDALAHLVLRRTQ